jgi:hypothetical protein
MYLTDYPHLINEIDFDKNDSIDYSKIKHGSHKKLWWTHHCNGHVSNS